MFRFGRVSVLLALALVLSPRMAGADLFELPDPSSGDAAGSATVPSTLPLRDRQRATQATLAEHAVYYAFTDLGIGPEKQAEVTLKMSQMQSVKALPPDKAFVAGVRLAGRIQSEMNRCAGPAGAAARSVLRELATHRTTLPMAAGAPADAAARLEQAIAAAKAVIVSQHARFEYTKWLEEALADLAKNPA